ncbi:MAG: PAS domain-containing protein [Rhodobacteraceae bacterium]|nr:PAS domain-containing protein [Paracoccaceae bacterium]
MEMDGNVVSLAQRKAEVTPRVIQLIETYWEGLRNGRLVPTRLDVDPRGMTGALEFAFVLERIAPGMARFRVAGKSLNDLMGVEVRGMPFSTFLEPQFRGEMSDAMEAVFAEPAIVRMKFLSEGGFGRKPLEAQLIFLPLRSDLGDITRVLGALHYEGAHGRQPRRFAITDQSRQTLVGLAEPQGAEKNYTAPVPAPRPEPAFAERQGAFQHKPATGSEHRDRSHLRLVKTDT